MVIAVQLSLTRPDSSFEQNLDYLTFRYLSAEVCHELLEKNPQAKLDTCLIGTPVNKIC